jgi:ferredoxin
MSAKSPIGASPRIIARADFQSLLEVLQHAGYQILGPTQQNNAIVYDQLSTVEDLPVGLMDHQSGGIYRLEKTGRPDLFAYHVGPQSWKKLLYPSSKQIWKADRHHTSFQIAESELETQKRAFVGVRPCELKAIEILDKVLTEGPFVDRAYKAAREDTFIVAVNCTASGDTCFCGSMDAGPRATSGFDIALTEIVEKGQHAFVAESGTKHGARLLGEVPGEEARAEDLAKVTELTQLAAASQTRKVDLSNIQAMLNANTEHPEWENVARRCLSCGNCTMVCPTCFCTNVRDYTDLSGSQAWRQREWDSCFTVEFSYIFGGSIRNSGKSRYRQWMTHKLGNWIGQFGRPGCVGCGRCITWCPVGIDITEEARAIRDGGQQVGVSTDKRDAEDGKS